MAPLGENGLDFFHRGTKLLWPLEKKLKVRFEQFVRKY